MKKKIIRRNIGMFLIVILLLVVLATVVVANSAYLEAEGDDFKTVLKIGSDIYTETAVGSSIYCKGETCFNSNGEHVKNTAGDDAPASYSLVSGSPTHDPGIKSTLDDYTRKGDVLVQVSGDSVTIIQGETDSVTIPKAVYDSDDNDLKQLMAQSGVTVTSDEISMLDGSYTLSSGEDYSKAGVQTYDLKISSGGTDTTTNYYLLPNGETIAVTDKKFTYDGVEYDADEIVIGGNGDKLLKFLDKENENYLTVQKDDDSSTITQYKSNQKIKSEKIITTDKTSSRSNIEYGANQKVTSIEGTLYTNGCSTCTVRYQGDSEENGLYFTTASGVPLGFIEGLDEDSTPDSVNAVTVFASDGSAYGTVINPKEALADGIIEQDELTNPTACEEGTDGSNPCKADTAIGEFANYQQRYHRWTRASSALSSLGTGATISNLLGIDETWAGITGPFGIETVADWDRWFQGTVLGDQYWQSAICAAKYPDIQNGDVAFLDTGRGFQGIGAANAEVHSFDDNDRQPILCYDSEEGMACPIEGYECDSDTICIDDDGEYLLGYQYKISWGVKAPADEALTPLLDENGYAISYNIVLLSDDVTSYDTSKNDVSSICSRTEQGVCVRFYEYQGNELDPLRLLNGNSDGQTAVIWSTKIYRSICLDFEDAPLTVSYWPAREGQGLPGKNDLAGSSGQREVPDHCNAIVEVSKGVVDIDNFEFVEADRSTYSSAPQDEVYSSDGNQNLLG
jgi:hypothetical protein